MTSTLESYREQREALLARVTAGLVMDERFVAGWLTGSYARGEADALSDIDISVVEADPYSEVLCRRFEQVSAQTSPERYFFSASLAYPHWSTKTITMRRKVGRLLLFSRPDQP